MTIAQENNLKVANNYNDTRFKNDVKRLDDSYKVEIFTRDQHIIDSIELQKIGMLRFVRWPHRLCERRETEMNF